MTHPIRLAILLIVIATTGTLIWSVLLHEEHDVVISITAFAIGVVTFFSVAEMNRAAPEKPVLGGEGLRTAIACSLVISYLYIVCFTTFVKTAEITGGVTQEFVKSFSNVIGITIAFYFGASAATQIFGTRRRDEPEPRDTPSPK